MVGPGEDDFHGRYPGRPGLGVINIATATVREGSLVYDATLGFAITRYTCEKTQ